MRCANILYTIIIISSLTSMFFKYPKYFCANLENTDKQNIVLLFSMQLALGMFPYPQVSCFFGGVFGCIISLSLDFLSDSFE